MIRNHQELYYAIYIIKILFPFLKERVICEKFTLKIQKVCLSVPNQSDFSIRRITDIAHWEVELSWNLGNRDWGVRISIQIRGERSKEHRLETNFHGDRFDWISVSSDGLIFSEFKGRIQNIGCSRSPLGKFFLISLI